MNLIVVFRKGDNLVVTQSLKEIRELKLKLAIANDSVKYAFLWDKISSVIDDKRAAVANFDEVLISVSPTSFTVSKLISFLKVSMIVFVASSSERFLKMFLSSRLTGSANKYEQTNSLTFPNRMS